MARSLIGKHQVRDSDFLSEEEHRTEAVHTFTQLSDVTTWSGHVGEFLQATSSGTTWATISTSSNIDGGSAFSVFGGTVVIDAGNASSTY